jgi:hypothetical protein
MRKNFLAKTVIFCMCSFLLFGCLGSSKTDDKSSSSGGSTDSYKCKATDMKLEPMSQIKPQVKLTTAGIFDAVPSNPTIKYSEILNYQYGFIVSYLPNSFYYVYEICDANSDKSYDYKKLELKSASFQDKKYFEMGGETSLNGNYTSFGITLGDGTNSINIPGAGKYTLNIYYSSADKENWKWVGSEGFTVE